MYHTTGVDEMYFFLLVTVFTNRATLCSPSTIIRKSMARNPVFSNGIQKLFQKTKQKYNPQNKVEVIKKCKQQLKAIFQMNFFSLFHHGSQIYRSSFFLKLKSFGLRGWPLSTQVTQTFKFRVMFAMCYGKLIGKH